MSEAIPGKLTGQQLSGRGPDSLPLSSGEVPSRFSCNAPNNELTIQTDI